MCSIFVARPSFAQGAFPAGQGSAAGPITLHWTAPAECPAADDVAARMNRLLGGPPKPGDHKLEATATVEPLPRGYRLEITVTSGDYSSTRILQGAQCDAVADAAALVIALAFDPDAVAAADAKQATSGDAASGDGTGNSASGNSGPGNSAPGNSDAGNSGPGNSAPPANSGAFPGDPGAPPPPPAAGVVRIPVVLRRTPLTSAPFSTLASTPVTFGALVQAALDVGSLPGAAPGVRAGVSVGVGPYRIEPAFEAWPSSRSALADRPSIGADLRLLAFSLDLCRRAYPWTAPTETGHFGLFGCLGFELGEMHGDGFGVTVPRSAGALWTAPRAAVRAEIPLYRGLALSLDAGLAVPLDRRTFTLTLTGTRTALHEPNAAAVRFGAGLSYRF
ncbi:MAG: hypothetical protein U0441_12125 [Polyangiaceae bacterium]